MTDIKKKVKDGIDNGAAKAKEVTDTAAKKASETAQKAGDAVQNAGKKIKNAGN